MFVLDGSTSTSVGRVYVMGGNHITCHGEKVSAGISDQSMLYIYSHICWQVKRNCVII